LVLLLGVLLGVAGDVLLRVGCVGFGASLWFFCATAAAFLAVRAAGTSSPVSVKWLMLPMIFFAGALAWRDSMVLATANLLALLGIAGLAARRMHSGKVSRGGVVEYSLGLFRPWLFSIGGALKLVATELRLSKRHEGADSERDNMGSRAVVRGLLLLVPLLGLFGVLLALADKQFADFLDQFTDLLVRWIEWKPGPISKDLAGHLILIGAVAWVSVGMLRLLARHHPEDVGKERSRDRWGFGPTETIVILGGLNVLFACFALVQVAHLFAASETSAYQAAQLARNGFFALAAVVGIAAPLMLFVHWALKPDHPAALRQFRIQAAVMTGLLAVFILFALLRMTLYVSVYGLTESRLYGFAFYFWLTFGLVWLARTLLRGRRERFAWGVLVAALVVVALLNLVNPDGLIVRVNTSIPAPPEGLDTNYLCRELSDDAVAPMIDALPGLEIADRQRAAIHLLDRWEKHPEDWRRLTLGRIGARSAVAEATEALSGLMGR